MLNWGVGMKSSVSLNVGDFLIIGNARYVKMRPYVFLDNVCINREIIDAKGFYRCSKGGNMAWILDTSSSFAYLSMLYLFSLFLSL